MPRNKTTVLEEKAKIFPKLHHFTREEMLDLAEADHEHIVDQVEQTARENARVGLPKPKKAESLSDMKKRIGSDRTRQLYEKAYKIYNEQLYKPDLHYNQLKEKYMAPGTAEKDFLCGDANLQRLTACITDPNATDAENMKLLSGDSAKVMKNMVRKLMQADLSGVMSDDPETFLDAMEKSGCAALLQNTSQLVTAFGQESIFDKDRNLKPNSPLMQNYAKSEAHPDGLDEEELQFVRENMNMFMGLSAAANRLMEMATPYYYTFPENDMEHRVMMKAAVESGEGGFLGNNADAYTDNTRLLNGQATYAMSFNPEGNSSNSGPLAVYHKALTDHPEICKNGWMGADYTAKLVQADGSLKAVEKDVALLEYQKDPNSVKFEMNAYGLKKAESHAADRNEVNDLNEHIHDLETELHEIYGSSWNASKEFNEFAKSLTELKKSAANEQRKSAPDMDKLSDMYEEMQKKAAEYVVAKEAELKKSGKTANSTRQRRMDFARKIMGNREPRAEKQTEKRLNNIIEQKQKDLRAIIQLGRQTENPIPIEQLKTGLKNKMAELFTAQTALEQVQKNGAAMDKDLLNSMSNPKALTAAANDVKKSAGFEKYASIITQENDPQKLLDTFEDIAATRKGGICMKNGLRQARNEMLQVSNKLKQDKQIHSAISGAEKKAQSSEKKADSKGLKA